MKSLVTIAFVFFSVYILYETEKVYMEKCQKLRVKFLGIMKSSVTIAFVFPSG